MATTALLATQPVNEAWTELTGEDSMSANSNLLVRMEMLFLFLQMVNRVAFAVGGPQARARIQDAISFEAVKKVVTGSFDVSQARKDFDAKEWQQRMISDSVGWLNESELDYASCSELFGLNEATVVGKLGARIVQAIDQPDNQLLQFVVSVTAMEALSKSGLMEQVKRACALVA